ncbi:YjbH domain-containing protein [Gammaproteobacteria bacterium]|nr:YjbH domain-containing protein [Gammaproteobacteria bacterium]
MRNYLLIFSIFIFTSGDLYSDSFKYNSFNNHGVIGLINMPSARFYDEASHGITIYDGTPDQKITMTSFPYDWMEASFFYMNIEEIRLCRNNQFGDRFCQGYKDKGFNFKFRLKEEGAWPAIAVGINDIAGTGYYSSEYIVASYGINRMDFHFGVGWGTLNGSSNSFKNPLGYLYDGFNNRPTKFEDKGGQFQPGRYFSGKMVSPFFGLSHAINENLLFKFEYDSTLTPGLIGYEIPKEDFSYGIEYSFRDNFTVGFSRERGNYTSLKFIYKNNPKKFKSDYKYKKAEFKDDDSKYAKLIKSIEANGIGVNKIIETPKAIGLELTQFAHPNLDIVEEIIRNASYEAGVGKTVKKNLRVANLQGVSEYNKEFENNSLLIYQRKSKRSFNTKTNFTFRPYLASREEFLKGALLLENNSELIIKDNFFFSTNLKYSIADNFEDLTLPPVNTYPAQVRSDVKDYLRSFGDGIFIGRAQFDYHITPKKNHHLMVSAGILEEMFSGVGFEYLYFKQDSNYAFGFEIFDVTKRDYEMRFGTLEYKNVTGSANFYYRNYDIIPFDAKISYGEYLAGDEGITFELSRSFLNGTKFGVFASFTDVSSEQFGEGTFDKGIFFNIPVYGNFINYSWRPLTKDPGAKLNRKHTLHDLLIKFKPYNY